MDEGMNKGKEGKYQKGWPQEMYSASVYTIRINFHNINLKKNTDALPDMNIIFEKKIFFHY